MDTSKWAEIVGLMLIGRDYGLTVNSTDADFAEAARRIVADAKIQHGVTLDPPEKLAAAFKQAVKDRKAW